MTPEQRMHQLGGNTIHINGRDRRRQKRDERRQPQSEPPELRIINPTSLNLAPVPVREWIIENWIPVGSVTALYGDGGVGKTLLAQQLMTATATSASWFGHKVMRCRSFGLFCEDDEEELHRRQDHINDHLGIGFDALSAMRWVSGVGEDNILGALTSRGVIEPTERYHQIANAVKAFGARLAVFDTAADLFGGNENDRGQVRRFIGLLSRLALEIQGGVLLNAHPSRTGLSTGNMDGGNTAWNNSVRSRLSFMRPKAEDGTDDLDTPERILTKRKANYSSTGDTIRLRWVNGAFASVGAAMDSTSGASRRAECELVFLDLLARMMTESRSVSDSPNATNSAPRLFAEQPDRRGFTRRDFNAAMQQLFADGRIKAVEYGRDHGRGKPRKIEPVPAGEGE